MDPHLGDGLFHLCALVHAYMADFGQETTPTSPREYQSVREIGGKTEVLFKPSGEHPNYFLNYIARINSAGWHPFFFPIQSYMHKIDLSGAILSGVILSGAILSGVILRGAHLSDADLSYADLSYANLSYADLSDTNVNEAYLEADFLLLQTEILNEFEKARFDFVYLDLERLDRRTALQRLREMQHAKPGSAEARQVEAKELQEPEEH